MKPLDPGQRHEVEYQLAQGSLRNLALFRRVIAATSVAAAYTSVIALLVALADGPWLLLGMLAFALVGLIMLPGLLFPERAAEWGVRFMMQTEESVKRGDHGRHWPR